MTNKIAHAQTIPAKGKIYMFETYDSGGARNTNAAAVPTAIEMNSICGTRSGVMYKTVPVLHALF